MLSQKMYLNCGGNQCPRCLSYDITGETFFEAVDDEAWRITRCKDCGLRYRDLYRLIGYELLEEENTE